MTMRTTSGGWRLSWASAKRVEMFPGHAEEVGSALGLGEPMMRGDKGLER